MRINHNTKDLHPGDRFGRLTVVSKTTRRDNAGNVLYRCVCDCGKATEVRRTHLVRGLVRSCGCLRDEKAVEIGHSHAGKKPVMMQKSYDLGLGTNLGTISSQKLDKRNTSGHTGVSYDRAAGKWKAYLNFQHVTHHLGYYSKFEDAVKAREAAEAEYFDPALEQAGLK